VKRPLTSTWLHGATSQKTVCELHTLRRDNLKSHLQIIILCNSLYLLVNGCTLGPLTQRSVLKHPISMYVHML
jgi:hypothetical protein